MIWLAMIGALGGILLAVALVTTEDIVEGGYTWIGQRLGIGMLRVLTLGRYPRGPVGEATRLAATLVGILLLIGWILWALYLWRAA